MKDTRGGQVCLKLREITQLFAGHVIAFALFPTIPESKQIQKLTPNYTITCRPGAFASFLTTPESDQIFRVRDSIAAGMLRRHGWTKMKMRRERCSLPSNCFRGMKAAEILKYFQSLPMRTLTRGAQ